MKRYQKIILVIVVSLITICGGIIYWINQFLIVGVAFFVSTFFLINNKSNKWLTLLFLLTPFLLIYGGAVLLDLLIGTPSPWVYPIVFISIISAFLGLGFKLLYLKYSKKSVIIFASLYLVLFIIGGYIFMYNWLSYTLAIENKRQTEEISDIKIWDFADNEIKIDKIENKVIVLNFWSKHCGGCFQKFPDFEKIKNYYNDKDVVFYAVFIPWDISWDYEPDALKKRLQWMEEQNFTFNIVKTDTTTSKLFGITRVPHLIVFDKNKRVAYSDGFRFQEKKIVLNNLYSIIDKSLKK